MARIVIADSSLAFDGRTPEQRPSGGAESAVVSLANAFARADHAVSVHNRCETPVRHRDVDWVPLANGLPAEADFYIANRSHFLIGAMPAARRKVFWIHNPARYLLKARYLWPLWRVRPAIVFSGASHAATYPAWAPAGRRVIIPLGIDDMFRSANERAAPPARAIFTSNPQRGLAWLLRLWRERIRPAVPQGELHVFSGAAVYGGDANPKAAAMAAIIDEARAMAPDGVVLRAPVARAALVDEITASRVMLYRGDEGETFSLALAEAQALGVPCVVQPIAAVPERIRDGETGHVAVTEQDFAAAAIRLLTDDAHWDRQHRAALAHQRSFGWDEAAAAWAGAFL